MWKSLSKKPSWWFLEEIHISTRQYPETKSWFIISRKLRLFNNEGRCFELIYIDLYHVTDWLTTSSSTNCCCLKVSPFLHWIWLWANWFLVSRARVFCQESKRGQGNSLSPWCQGDQRAGTPGGALQCPAGRGIQDPDHRLQVLEDVRISCP